MSRFPRAATVYPLIETLGASTDLEYLKSVADSDPNVDTRIGDLRRTVAALEADTISAEIKLQQRVERILTQASIAATVLADFNVEAYGRERAAKDLRALGSALETTKQTLDELRTQAATRADTLAEKKTELVGCPRGRTTPQGPKSLLAGCC
ncbi:MAG: hypothetical protein ACRDPW_03995 [Mycobacteriales bacterium]